MRKIIILLILVFSASVASMSAQSDKQTKPVPPSDDPNYTFTYDIEEVQQIIFDRIDNPSKKNEYAAVVTTDMTFPQLKGNSESAKAQFKKDVKAWIEANPGKIEKLMNEKKKAEQSKK